MLEYQHCGEPRAADVPAVRVQAEADQSGNVFRSSHAAGSRSCIEWSDSWGRDPLFQIQRTGKSDVRVDCETSLML